MAEQQFQHIVRIANTDLDGNKGVVQALTKIRGVGDMFANAVCNTTKIDRSQKMGNLSQDSIEKLNTAILNPADHAIPTWMFNRRNNPDDGVTKHIISTDIKYIQENDKKMMAMTKSYKGIRHQAGLPVRGQRTKSNFRKNKGKVQGVKRKSSGKKGK